MCEVDVFESQKIQINWVFFFFFFFLMKFAYLSIQMSKMYVCIIFIFWKVNSV